MKALLCFLLLLSSAYAQDPSAYLKSFDAKVYSLKSKGVKDFVVDIENAKLTKNLNDQQLFGKVEELIFRVYWTANPERLAIEVVGLPQGFKEVKEDLKMAIMGVVESLIPQSMEQKFSGYKFSPGATAREIMAKDTSGIAPVPSFLLKFDEQDKLIEVRGVKPIGTLIVKPKYEKESFSDGKLVLKEQTTTTSENGQTLIMTKELEYGDSQGIGVLTEVEASTEHRSSQEEAKPMTTKESITFKNYKINSGDALKYFLGESKAAPVKN